MEDKDEVSQTYIIAYREHCWKHLKWLFFYLFTGNWLDATSETLNVEVSVPILHII